QARTAQGVPASIEAAPAALQLSQAGHDAASDDLEHLLDDALAFFGGAAERELALGSLAPRQRSERGARDLEHVAVHGEFELGHAESVLDAIVAARSPLHAPHLFLEHAFEVLLERAAVGDVIGEVQAIEVYIGASLGRLDLRCGGARQPEVDAR